jgi:dihydroorotate dehydrogenase
MSDKLLYALARPLLFSLDPETAHNLTLPACAVRTRSA